MMDQLKRYAIDNRLELFGLLIVMIAAFLLRIWRIDEFAIFLSDQVIDSYATKNILRGDFTLLGPRASVGDFFNGPAIYYLMAPFYFFMGSDPLSGAYFQIFFQIITIPFLFVIGKRMGGYRSGLFAIVIFAASPLFVYYSKAAFNAYPAIFLSTFVIYLLTFDKKYMHQYILAGIASGILVQAHYLLYVYVLFYFIYVVTLKKIGNTLGYLVGVVLGLSPFILFEIRNSFFNTNAIISHLLRGKGDTLLAGDRLQQFLMSVSQIFGYRDTFFGLFLTILFMVGIYIAGIKLKTFSNIFSWSIFALIASFIVYRGAIHPHYFIGIHTTIIVCIAALFSGLKIQSKLINFIFTVGIVTMLLSMSQNFAIPREQDGFGLSDQRKVSGIIAREMNEIGESRGGQVKWNVTQDLQQDNRAMPLRYMLSLNENITQPLFYDDYKSNDFLVVVKDSSKTLEDIKTWEFTSFGSGYVTLKSFDLNASIDMKILGKLK